MRPIDVEKLSETAAELMRANFELRKRIKELEHRDRRYTDMAMAATYCTCGAMEYFEGKIKVERVHKEKEGE
jgi:hypothetical protein